MSKTLFFVLVFVCLTPMACQSPNEPESSAIAQNMPDVPETEQAALTASPTSATANPAPLDGSASEQPITDDCFTDEKEWSFHLNLFAEQLEKDSIQYAVTPLSDCSGIFFRIAQFAQSKCTNYRYPDHTKTRDSRSIARWYHDQGNLNLVQDPMQSRSLIQTGSVMFFGRSGQKYDNVDIDLIAGTPEKRGVISHIGVVTEVKRNEAGQVTGYVMMHGRRKGVTAQRSHYHQLDPPRFGYPILGNWNQQWVAVGNIMTAGKPGEVLAENEFDSDGNSTFLPASAISESPTDSGSGTGASEAEEPTGATPAIANLPAGESCLGEAAWQKAITLQAEKLEKQNIMYTQTPASALADCSGIFYRLAQFAQSQCNQYQYPDHTKTRDSRSIARWFYDRGNLTLVQDPMKTRNQIRPGSVMFFGRPNAKYSNLTIEKMAGTPQARGAIFHVGVVTEVFKDDAGNVTGYVMMHGRSSGKPAKRTHYHKVEPPRIGFPILGSWNQQWVAIANIMTPAEASSLASR